MAKVVVLSGAGVSAESGISTFRDSDGLWEEYDIKDICTAGCLVSNRTETIEFYDKRREELADKEPNRAHILLSELKKKYNNRISIITQNVDDLFEKAGLASTELIHLHGYLPKIECEECTYVYEIGYKKQEDSFDGKCPECGSSHIRPFIVMFGEQAPKYELLNKELEDCEFIVIIGTSGNVIGVNTMAQFIEYSILNNLEPSEAIEEELFSKLYYMKASEAIDRIVEEIEFFLEK